MIYWPTVSNRRVKELNPANYFGTIADKWFGYRKHLLSKSYLIQFLKGQYDFLQKDKVYEREGLIYPVFDPSKNNLDYTIDWIDNRLFFFRCLFPRVEKPVNGERIYAIVS